jgi:glutathione S-transferase
MTWAQGLARLPLQVLTDELGHRLDELLEFLGSRPFFFSDRVSAADLALFGQFSMQRSGPTPQAETLINARPALLAYIERVDAATAA